MADTAVPLAGLIVQGITAETALDDIVVHAITADSRQVVPGTLFAALAGSKTDGSRFITDAVARGAVAVLAASGAPCVVPHGVALLRADEPRRALALMAARFYGRQPPTIVAVTGTNGKTSIAEFTRQIFAALGRKAASLGTIGLVKPDGAVYGSLDDAGPRNAAQDARGTLADEGVTHLVMEASSHGLDQFRLDGVGLTTAAFNNLGRDHLDYHPTMEAYLAAKLRLFRELMRPGQTVVVNADGPSAEAAVAAARDRGLNVLTTGRTGAALTLANVERAGFGQRLRIRAVDTAVDCELPLIGEYQGSNVLVAAALAVACGEPVARCSACWAGSKACVADWRLRARSTAGSPSSTMPTSPRPSPPRLMRCAPSPPAD